MPYSHSLELEDGSVTTYDQLLIATGGKARTLDVPGHELNNIFTLHQAKDAPRHSGIYSVCPKCGGNWV